MFVNFDIVSSHFHLDLKPARTLAPSRNFHVADPCLIAECGFLGVALFGPYVVGIVKMEHQCACGAHYLNEDSYRLILGWARMLVR